MFGFFSHFYLGAGRVVCLGECARNRATLDSLLSAVLVRGADCIFLLIMMISVLLTKECGIQMGELGNLAALACY